MRIGLFYQIQVPKPWTAQSEAQRIYEALEQIPYAEAQGFDSVWFSEHHFRPVWSQQRSRPDLGGGEPAHQPHPARSAWCSRRSITHCTSRGAWRHLTLPRKSGHRVRRTFASAWSWGDVADGGVDPLTIVVALDVGKQVAPSGIPTEVFALVDEFGFSVPKKLSIGALSQQFAFRLIDWVMAAARRISR